MSFDYKKEYKEYYLPKNIPSIINIPKMNFLAVRGTGNPNNQDGDYQKTLGLLYAIAFTIKMSYKGNHKIDGYFSYVVPPLEGFWWQEGIKGIDFSKIEFFTYEEGICVQCMHHGTYDDEPKTVALMHQYAKDNGYELDITDKRYHHEIYLSDPRRCKEDNLKTVIRHPIKRRQNEK